MVKAKSLNVLIIKSLIIPILTCIASSCVIPEKYKKEIEF